MDTNTSYTLGESHSVSKTQTIIVKPFLDNLKVKDTTKKCVATRVGTLSAKALK